MVNLEKMNSKDVVMFGLILQKQVKVVNKGLN